MMHEMTLKEKEFDPKFDVIATRERLTLDIERDKYPEESVCFYLNGTTGEFSTKIEDVLQDGRNHIEVKYNDWNGKERKHLSAQYDEEQKLVFLHMIYRNITGKFRSGTRLGYLEFGRFALDKNRNVYKKQDGPEKTDRCSYCNIEPTRYRNRLLADKKGEYFCGRGKFNLPFSIKNYQSLFSHFVNMTDGSNKGFIGEMQHIYPVSFNETGNVYSVMTDYPAVYKYFEVMQEGPTCLKKSGKKQDYIDKVVSFELPPVEKPDIIPLDTFAVIQKVENAEEPTCVVRTMQYVKNEDLFFEGGRIYVTKKTAEFCKLNNLGEWVHQGFPQKIKHWDFSIVSFDQEETKGTMLEYFGEILDEISFENRAVAIYTFIKQPFVESLAKLTSADIVDKYIDMLRDYDNSSDIFIDSLGVSEMGNKKIMQALGISKQQFEQVKEILADGIIEPLYDGREEGYTLPYGLLPFTKHMLSGNSKGVISDIDIETFKKYLDFSIEAFSAYDIYPMNKLGICNIMDAIMNLRNSVVNVFPEFRVEKLFPVFLDLLRKEGLYGCTTSRRYVNNGEIGEFRDYLTMVRQLPNKNNYKPDFSSLQDITTMHDNITILCNMSEEDITAMQFQSRKEIWDKWIFSRDEKKDKFGNIKEKGFPFVVVAPTSPADLVEEGTRLHHCVRSYIDRVADGQTNIMFIRKKENPDEPFFTVEISNDRTIEQVHGFANRNANTEEGLTEFVNTWAKARRLKTHTINKVR